MNDSKTPYNKSYYDNKRVLYMFLGALGVLALVVPLIYMLMVDSSSDTEVSHPSAKPVPAPLTSSQAPDSGPAEVVEGDESGKEEEEDRSYRVEMDKLAREINRKAGGEPIPADPALSPSPTSAGASSPSAAAPPASGTPAPASQAPASQGSAAAPVVASATSPAAADNRRFYFDILHDYSSPVDITLYDSHTSRLRLYENYESKHGPIIPFTDAKTHPDLFLRYSVSTHYNDAKIEAFVIDEYTGDIIRIKDFAKDTDFKPFNDTLPYKYGLLRYAMLVVLNGGKWESYICDTVTGQVRVVVNPVPGQVYKVFSSDPSHPKTVTAPTHRYFICSVSTMGQLQLFGIDSHNGAVMMHTQGDSGKPFRFFPTPGEDNPVPLRRFSANVRIQDGLLKVFTVDNYTSEMRIRYFEDLTRPKRIFQTESHSGYYRYNGWVNTLNSDVYIFHAIDRFTGAVKVSEPIPLPANSLSEPNMDGIAKPIRLFKEENQTGSLRFYGTLVYRLEGGVDFYVMDTFSGELRIKTQVNGKQTFNLF